MLGRDDSDKKTLNGLSFWTILTSSSPWPNILYPISCVYKCTSILIIKMFGPSQVNVGNFLILLKLNHSFVRFWSILHIYERWWSQMIRKAKRIAYRRCVCVFHFYIRCRILAEKLVWKCDVFENFILTS